MATTGWSGGRTGRRTAIVVAVGLIAVVLGATGCGAPDQPGPTGIRGWPIETIRVGDRTLTVTRALDTSAGLSGIDSLGGLDGMLFAYPQEQSPTSRRFHMTDVRFPLDALFFDAGGVLIESVRMEPCPAEPCPRYAPARPYRWVVEVPAGSLRPIPGAVLRMAPADDSRSDPLPGGSGLTGWTDRA